MKKILLISALALVIFASPLAIATQSTDSGWQPTSAMEAWNRGDYRVERLAFKSGAIGPFKLGDFLFVAVPVDSCRPNFCNRYDLWRLENGMKLFLGNVPTSALDAQRFALNGNRLVYANLIDENARTYSVVERNLENGATTTLIDSVFLNGAQEVGVMVEGAYVYLNPEFEFQTDVNSGTKYRQAVTILWDAHWREAKPIGGKRWDMRREQIMDVNNGVVLVKMVFERGNKELWLMDSNTNKITAVPGSWIEPHGDIQTARLLADGSVEYFAYFTRHTFNPARDASALKYTEHLLSWSRPVTQSVQIAGERLAWLNPDDRLFVSENGKVKDVGVAPGGRFALEDSQLAHAVSVGLSVSSNSAFAAPQGKILTFTDSTAQTLTFAATDLKGQIAVGLDFTNNVWYRNLQTGATVRLGFGSDAYVSDERHVYWKGLDGIYEATINPGLTMRAASPTRAVRVRGTDTVYMTDGATRKTIPNEPVFFSWFGSFREVVEIDATTLAMLTDAGVATFAPGTKVKHVGDPKVYVVGSDGKFHWLTNQSVAHAIYGEEWNRGIVQARIDQTLQYPFGGNITKEADLQTI